jgi:Matrixin
VKKILVRLVIVAAALSAPSAGHAGEAFRLLLLDGFAVKWGTPVLGSPASVSYALVTVPTTFPEARNCKSMRPMAELAGKSPLAPERIDHEVETAFAAWRAAAAIDFRRSSDTATADILIGVMAEPSGIAYSDVDHRPQAVASNGVASIRRALICFNPERRWTIGFDGDPHTIDLRYAAMHEIGHAIGLNHPSPEGQLMSFKYLERFRDLQDGDRAGAVALYGPRVPLTASGNGIVKAAVRK